MQQQIEMFVRSKNSAHKDQSGGTVVHVELAAQKGLTTLHHHIPINEEMNFPLDGEFLVTIKSKE